MPRVAGVPDGLLEAGSQLCRSCGLCCGGTLFGAAPLTQVEASRLRTRLDVIASDEGQHRLRLPCRANDAGGCAVYADRPDVCANYACKLLKRVRAGEMEAASAAAIVARIRGLLSSLEPRLPPGDDFWARRRALPVPGEPVSDDITRSLGGRPLAELWLDLKVLDLLLTREIEDGETGGAT